MRGNIFVSVVVVLLASGAVAAFSGPTFTESSKTGLSFLRIAPVAGNAGMGSAGVASSAGASAVWWNPSLIAMTDGRSAHFSHTDFVAGIRQEYAAVSGRTFLGDIGGSVQLFDSGDIAGYDADAAPVGNYSIKYASFAVTCARRLSETVAVGVTYKNLLEKVAQEDASGYALDAGVTVRLPIEGVVFAAALRNYGRMTPLRNERTKLPTDAAAGVSWRGSFFGIDRPFDLSAEFVAPRYGKKGVRLGLDLEPVDRFHVRAGYRGDSDTEHLSCGVGMSVGKFTVDASFTPMKQFNENALRFTLSLADF